MVGILSSQIWQCYGHWTWCIFNLYSKSCKIKNLLVHVQEIKDLMRHGKGEANHPRMYYAHFWTKTANNYGLWADHASLKHRTYLADPVQIGVLTKSAKIPQLTQPAYSVRGMSCLNPLGYVRSQFSASILISLASVQLLWKFISPLVPSHWSTILNLGKLNPRSRSAKMRVDYRRCSKEF